MKNEEIFLFLWWGSNFVILVEIGRIGELLVRVWVLLLIDLDKCLNVVVWVCRLIEVDDELLNFWVFYIYKKSSVI